MNKKGFTLVELLAVIAIMALIAGISVPNIINMLDKGKQEDFIKDAKSIVAKAKYRYNMEKYKDMFGSDNCPSTESTCSCIKLKNLNFSTETDAYGYTYDKENSYVAVCDNTYNNTHYNTYKIYLQSGDTSNGGKCLSTNSLSTNSTCGVADVDKLSYEYVIDR